MTLGYTSQANIMRVFYQSRHVVSLTTLDTATDLNRLYQPFVVDIRLDRIFRTRAARECIKIYKGIQMELSLCAYQTQLYIGFHQPS